MILPKIVLELAGSRCYKAEDGLSKSGASLPKNTMPKNLKPVAKFICCPQPNPTTNVTLLIANKSWVLAVTSLVYLPSPKVRRGNKRVRFENVVLSSL
jgi:hypothetical protein